MNKSLLEKGIVNVEMLDSKGDRWVSYHTNGTAKISEFPDVIPGQGCPPSQEVTLRDWEEICRLRDFLNSLQPFAAPVELQKEEADHHERTA